MRNAEKLSFLLAGIVNFLFFAIMNYLSWNGEATKFNAPSRIRFDHEGYSWGWPFNMYNNYTSYPSSAVGFGPGVIFNILAFVFLTSLLGIVLIYLHGLVFKRGADLK